MRRAVLLPLAFGLAALTGVALLGAAHVVTDGTVTPDRSSANAAVVLRFYDAVNALLQTGSATALADVLAPDFVDHAGRAGLPPTGQGLVRYLSGLRVAFPVLRLTAEDVVAQSQRVAVRVRVEGADHGTYLGLPVDDGLAPWGALDAFRIEDGRIGEHWGGHDAPVVLEPLVPSPLVAHLRPIPVVGASSLLVVRVRRLRLEPGARTEAVAVLDTVIFVEEGRIGARVASPAGVVPGDAVGGVARDPTTAEPETLNVRGDVLTVPTGATFALRNAGGAPAVVLAMTAGLSLFPEVSPSSQPTDPPTQVPTGSGWDEEIVEASQLVPLPAGQLAVAAGRVTLAPGGTFLVGSATGLALLVVERGTLTVDGGAEREASAIDVLSLTESTDLRNAGTGPLTLLVVTVDQGNPGDATATSS